jgi:hypothetical protein
MTPGLETSPPETPAKKPAPAVPILAHLACGWPLVLVLVGGMIGGGLGGAAYGVNMGIYRSTLPWPIKAVLILLTGFAAIGVWMAIALALQSARQ